MIVLIYIAAFIMILLALICAYTTGAIFEEYNAITEGQATMSPGGPNSLKELKRAGIVGTICAVLLAVAAFILLVIW